MELTLDQKKAIALAEARRKAAEARRKAAEDAPQAPQMVMEYSKNITSVSPLPEGFEEIEPPVILSLPEGFTAVPPLPEGFEEIEFPFIDPTEAYQMIMGYSKNITSVSPELDKVAVANAVKLRTSATYIASLSGLNPNKIDRSNYSSYAKAVGLSGNHEADFEIIKNKMNSGLIGKLSGTLSKVIPGKSSVHQMDNLDELLTKDRTNKTNILLKSTITNGFKSLDEFLTRTAKTVSGSLADINPYLTQKENELTAQIESINKRLDKKRIGEFYVTVDDPDVIELRQAKVQLDAIQDTRKASQRRGLFYDMLEESEALIRAGRAFEETATLATDEEFNKTWTAKLISTAGSIIYSFSSFGLGKIAGLTANFAQVYQATVDDARASGATEQQALEAGFASIPSAAIDPLLDKFIITKFLKPLRGKMTVGELSKNIAAAIASGGFSEGAEQLWQNINAKYLTVYDKDRLLDDEVLVSIVLGAMAGGAPAVTSVAQLVPGFGSIKTVNPTDAEWDMIRKFETDEQIINNRGPLALDAANGNLDARAEYRKMILSNEDANNQPFGPLQPEPDLTRAEMDALDGRVLNQLNDEQADTPMVSDEDLAVLDLNEEADLVARDTEGRADEDTTELLPAEKKLVNLELEQELSALDEELAANAPALADENLSKAAKELAELELAETEGIVNKDLTKEQQERLAAGQDVDLSPSTQIDKKTAKFLAQIVKVENKLNAKIAKLKKQITKNRTDAKAAKLEALGKLQERIRKIRSLAALSKREALKRAGEKAAERLAKEVQKRLNIVKKNLEDRKNLTQSTKDLKNLIGQLPRSIKGDLNVLFERLSSKVSEKAHRAILQEAIGKIQSKIESYNTKINRSKLQKLIKVQSNEIRNAESANKKPSRKLTDIRNWMSERGLLGGDRRQSITEEAEAIQERIAEAEALGKSYTMSDHESKIMAKSFYPDLTRNDLTATEYADAIADLESLRKEGKTLWDLKKQAESTKITSKINLIKSEIESRLNEKGSDVLDQQEVKEFQGKIKTLTAGKFSLIDYRAISILLTGRKNSKIKKFIFDSISESMSEGILKHSEYVKMVQDLEKKHQVKMQNASDFDLLTIGNKPMSIHQAMFVYGHSQNLAGLRHLANTKFGKLRLQQKQVDLINQALPQNYKDFVDALIDYNDTVMYPRLNEMFQRVYGVPMPKVERYLPLSNLSQSDSFGSILEDAYVAASTNNSFLKARIGSKKAFRSLNLIDTLYRHNQTAEHTIAMKENLETINRVMGNKSLQNAMNSVDTKIVPWIKDYLIDVGRGKLQPPDDALVATLRVLRNNTRSFFIAFNPGSWLKTQTPILSAMQDVDTGSMLATLMNPLAGKSNWELAKSKSKFMATRKTTARMEIMEIAQTKSNAQNIGNKLVAKSIRAMTRAQSAAYWVYTPLDLASTSAVWVAQYRSVLSKTGDEVLAINKADDTVKTHFPSGRIDELPALFRSGGLQRELTVFTSDMNKIFNLGYSKTQLKDKKIQEAIVFAVYSIILSSLFLAATDIPYDAFKEFLGLKDKEKDRKDRFIKDALRYSASQTLGGIPLVGQTAEAKVASLVGDGAMSELIMRQTPIFAYPAVQLARGNYVTAASSAAGLPAGSLIAPLIDDYLNDED